jgi:hypothetical protein
MGPRETIKSGLQQTSPVVMGNQSPSGMPVIHMLALLKRS